YVVASEGRFKLGHTIGRPVELPSNLMMSSLASTSNLDSAFDGGHALRDIASGSGSAASPPRSKGPREAAKPTSGRASDDDVEVLKHIARGLEQRQVRKYLSLGRSSD